MLLPTSAFKSKSRRYNLEHLTSAPQHAADK
jgi:hypothetical protein